MPEGHTLFALARDLNATFAGTRPSVTSPQGRFTQSAALLDGTTLRRASARGKHLLLEFDADRWVNIHLGLIGKFSITRFAEPLPRREWSTLPVVGQVRLRLVNAAGVADLRGATRCVLMNGDEAAAVIARLGPDPLQDNDFGEDTWERVQRSSRSVAELLMDQSIISGVGNVYRCEVLFRNRIKPFVPGKELRRASWEAIWADLRRLMPLGVELNQIVTVEEQVLEVVESLSRGRTTPVPKEYYVYRRAGEACLVCGHRISTQVLAGRNLFWCGTTQRRH